MKKLIKIFSIVTVVGYGVALAQDRDPFTPYTWTAPASTDSADKTTDGANPLIDKPLSSYTVIGVVVSPTDALAVLKSRDKHEYFAYIGDKVGSEGGTLETISTEGITVDMAGKVVPLKVSNRFENQDEKPTDEKK